VRNIPTYVAILLAITAAAFLGLSSRAGVEIRAWVEAACKENPTHVICQEHEAKTAAAKAKREAKADAAIRRVKENN